MTSKNIFIVTVLALSLEGCQYFKDFFSPVFQRPVVTVQNVQLGAITYQKVSLKIKLLVQNPNSFSLDFSNLNYQIFLNKELVGYGNYKGKIELKQQENSELALPLTIENETAFKILREAFSSQDALKLQIKGWVDFHSVLGAIKVDFDHTQELLRWRQNRE